MTMIHVRNTRTPLSLQCQLQLLLLISKLERYRVDAVSLIGWCNQGTISEQPNDASNSTYWAC